MAGGKVRGFFPSYFLDHFGGISGKKEEEGRCVFLICGEKEMQRGWEEGRFRDGMKMANSKFDFTRDLVTGVLKGHDQLMNLVLDDVMEVLHGEFDWFCPFCILSCLLDGWPAVVYRSCLF